MTHLEHTFHEQTNQARAHTLYHLILRANMPLPSSPRVSYHGESALALESPVKLFKVASPNPAYPALHISSHGNYKKASCACFPLVPSASSPTLVPSGVLCLLFLGIWENNNFFLPDSHFHTCVSYRP